jgi:peptidoglycan hydrolase-like protein with peptidoglycan-binding domain/tellurite resistance protein
LRSIRAFAWVLLFILATAAAGPASAQDVREAQRALQRLGHDTGGIDGVIGPRTREALISFQRTNGLPQTGELDEPTWRRLVDSAPPPSAPRQAVQPSSTAPPSQPATQSRPPTPPATPATSQPVFPIASAPTAAATTPTPAKPTSTSSWGGWIWAIVALVILVLFFGSKKSSTPDKSTVRRPPSSADPLARTSPGRQAATTAWTPVTPSRPATGAASPAQEIRQPQPKQPPQPGRGQAKWHGQGESVEVAGLAIPGMVYVGSRLPSGGGYGVENCLINPGLAVARSDPDRTGSTMPYWPSYSSIPPEARLAYLQWHASGRQDPSYDVGYPFLFLYGLERRLLVDRSYEEADAIAKEAESLLRVYGDNRSIRRYAGELLDVALALSPDESRVEQAAKGAMRAGTTTLASHVFLGRHVQSGRSLDAEAAMVWCLGTPGTQVGATARRAMTELSALFAHRFAQSYPDGFPCPHPTGRIAIQYRAASGTFTASAPEMVGRLPDLLSVEAPATLRSMFETSAEDVSAFGRFLKREPAGRGSLEAARLLPPEIASSVGGQLLSDLREWTGQVLADGPAVITAADLIRRTAGLDEEAQRIPRADYVATCEILARIDVAVEPDPRHGGDVPLPGGTVVLFPAAGGAPVDAAMPAYRTAMTFAMLGAAIVHADTSVSSKEETTLLEQAARSMGLTDTERMRIQAHVRLLLRSPPDVKQMKGKLARVPEEQRGSLARLAVALAAADGRVDASEMRLLERTYGFLGLPVATLYSDVHAMGASAEDVAVVRPAAEVEGRVPIPVEKPAGPAASGIRLDPERIRRIREDTTKVTGLLSEIFVEEVESKEHVEDPPSTPTRWAGLDGPHGAMLDELLQAGQLPRAEYDALARRHGLLPDGALETINDWSFEQAGDPLLLDEGDIVVDRTTAAALPVPA